MALCGLGGAEESSAVGVWTAGVNKSRPRLLPQGARLLGSGPCPGHCGEVTAASPCGPAWIVPVSTTEKLGAGALSPGVHARRGCGHRASFGSESTLRDQHSQSRLWAAWKGLLSTGVLRKEGVQFKEVVLS